MGSNNEALIELLDKYKNMVYKIALNYTKSSSSAEDIFQDVFIKYLKTKPVFNSQEHEKAWFIRVTINYSKNLLNSAWFKKTTVLEETILFEEHEDSELFFAVMGLPIKYREVIHLFYYEDYSVKEIAQLLHVRESAVTTRLQRARAQLKHKLEGDYCYE